MEALMVAKPVDVEANSDIRLVGGWASVEIVDRQNQIVPIEELEKALIRYSIRGAPLNYGHKNHQVGRVINWHIFKHPETGKWGVYIFAVIFSGEQIYDIVWDAVKSGKLTGFSIAGLAGNTEVQLTKENGIAKKAEVLRDITITEISIVEKPANQLAVIEKVNTFAKGDVEGNVLNIVKSNYVMGILDDLYDELKATFGKSFADKAISIFEDGIEKFVRGIVVGSSSAFAKEISENNIGGNVLAIFKDEYEAAKYALSHYGFVVPTVEGTFAVVGFKEDNGEEPAGVDVTNDIEGLEGLEQLGGLGAKKEEKLNDVKKEDGAVSSNAGSGYMNPVYGGDVRTKNDGEDKEDDKEKDAEEVVNGIKAVLDLFKKGDIDVEVLNMLRDSLRDELEAIGKYEAVIDRLKELGFDFLAEQLMNIVAEEKKHVGEFLEMINEVSPDDLDLMEEGREEVGGIDDVVVIEMADNVEHVRDLGKVLGIFDSKDDAEEYAQMKGGVVKETQSGRWAVVLVEDSIEKDIDSKDELKRILIGILNEAKKLKGFVENNTESGAYKGMADDVVKTIEALLDELARGDIKVEKGSEEEFEKKRGDHKKCMERYYNFDEGHFKGRAGTGERFDNCVKAQMHCNGKSKEEAEAICGKIARSKGYPKKKGKAPDIDKLRDLTKRLDDVIKKVSTAKEMKKSNCMKRYTHENGQFKRMACPDDGGKKSKFCGCVRAQMACNGKSLEDAKKICSYINREVKKINATAVRVTNNKVSIIEKKIKNIKKKSKKEGGDKKEGKQEKRGRPKDKCRAKYVTPDGKYKKMSDPRHPKKPISEFWGCVRYYMECKNKKYEDAKNMCGKARYEALSGGGERAKTTVSGRR